MAVVNSICRGAVWLRYLLISDRSNRENNWTRLVVLFIGEFGEFGFDHSYRAVKLIRAVERAEGGEIGAGVLDLRIFESIIGNTANGRSRSTGLDRNLRDGADRPSFRPLPHSTASPPFVGDPINSGPQKMRSRRENSPGTLSNR